MQERICAALIRRDTPPGVSALTLPSRDAHGFRVTHHNVGNGHRPFRSRIHRTAEISGEIPRFCQFAQGCAFHRCILRTGQCPVPTFAGQNRQLKNYFQPPVSFSHRNPSYRTEGISGPTRRSPPGANPSQSTVDQQKTENSKLFLDIPTRGVYCKCVQSLHIISEKEKAI